jgi:hypothetical protein
VALKKEEVVETVLLVVWLPLISTFYGLIVWDITVAFLSLVYLFCFYQSKSFLALWWSAY